MSSYMRERDVDALLVLWNENKWAMTGKISIFLFPILFLDIFLFIDFTS